MGLSPEENRALRLGLNRLGFGTYAEYLASSHWKQFSANVRKDACEICGFSEGELQVHHLSYERLGHESQADMRTLCRRCHGTAHGLRKRRKRKPRLPGSKGMRVVVAASLSETERAKYALTRSA